MTFTYEDVQESLIFLLKYPSPLEINEIEDEKERETLLDQYAHSLNVVEWAKKNAGEWKLNEK